MKINCLGLFCVTSMQWSNIYSVQNNDPVVFYIFTITAREGRNNWLTGHARIWRLQIHSQLRRTWFTTQKFVVWNRYIASLFAGTSSVEVIKYVCWTAKCIVATFDASANSHTTELGRPHDDHFTMATTRFERFQLTELLDDIRGIWRGWRAQHAA